MIAIVGVGCRLPGAPSKQAYWRLLRDGIDAISEVPHDRWPVDDWYSATGEPGKVNSRHGGFIDDVDQFDAAYFKLSPREAAWMDPQQRLLLEVACEALDDAGLLTDQLAGSRTGVFVGSNHSDYAILIRNEGSVPDPLYATGTSSSVIANRLSYLFDLRGPSLAIDTACSASLVALHLARQSLLSGESDQAVVAGVSLMLSPVLTAAFTTLGATSPDGRCKTFDARADGYGRGEGVGVVVLKTLEAALRDGDRIYATVLGSAVNQDGTTNGMTAPNGRAQEAVIREALRSGGVSPSQLSYVEAHGTGTLLGDSIEASALGNVLAGAPRSRPCALGSVKTNIGHLEGASGIAGVIKLALSLTHRTVPASLHFHSANPHIAFDTLALAVQARTEPWASDDDRRIAGISCFGFGGTNAHAVLGEVDAAVPTENETDRPVIVPISASSARALEVLAWSYLDELAPNGTLADASLEAIAHTAALRRKHLRFRLAIVARSRADFARQLREFLESRSTTRVALARSVPMPPPVAFVFSDTGGHWTGMARELLATEPVFRTTFEQLDTALQPHLKRSVIELVMCDAEPLGTATSANVKPTIFAYQVALAALWRSYGIEPAAMLGQGAGEVAAACASGALSYDEAARRICAHGESAGNLESSLRAALDDGIGAFLEISPHPVLRADVFRDAKRPPLRFSSTCKQRTATGERDELLRSVAAFHVHGYAIAWRPSSTRPVDLPRYPWRHERHWFTEKADNTASRATAIGERLARHPDVAAAVCRDVTTEHRRIAVVVPRANARLDAVGLRRWLHDSVDSRDLPVSISVVRELPVDPSAMASSDPFADLSATTRNHHARRTETEQVLAGIWSELLGVETVGLHDNFFTLGGNSLLVLRLLERTRHRGYALDVQTLFATPTVAALAAAMQSARREPVVAPRRIASGASTITPADLPLIELDQESIDRIVSTVPGGVANIEDIYALTHLQEGMVFHHRLAQTGDPYLQIFQMSFPDRALVERYLVAAQQVVDRHDILRTAFVFDGVSQPAQVVWRHAPIRVTDSVLDPETCRIDITQAPLLQYAIARDPRSDRWLVTSLLHHLISDRETIEIMNREIIALMADRATDLAPSRPFRNLVANVQRSADTSEDETFFRAMLGDIDEPTISFGVSDVRSDGHGITESFQAVPDALYERLRRQARRLGASLASICHVAWGQVLARTSGREDVVFGTVLFGRMALGGGAEGALGLYLNTLPFRISLDATDVETSIRRTHLRLAQLLAHEHASLPLAQRCSGVLPPAPLFTSLFNYRHVKAEAPDATNPLAGVEWLPVTERTNYPLMLSVNDAGHSLSISTQVVDTLSADGIADLFQTALAALCDALENEPRRHVRSLDVLPATERHRLLVEWNATAHDDSHGQCVHEQIEAQVNRTPDAQAIWCDGAPVTYRELDERANQLANHLIALGVQPEQRVAVVLDRSAELVIALLAIWKAGGAYVPLDPSHPAERIGYVLADAGARVVITSARHVALASHGMQTVLVDRDPIAARPSTPVEIASHPGQLAYVMYTSGSTGRPKGVQIEHRALANLITAMQRRIGVTAKDTLVAVTTSAFDISGLELWLPLCTGARVIVATAEEAMDPALLARLVDEHAATLLQATPATWRSLVDAGWKGRRELVALCGGEAIPADLVAALDGKVARVWNVYGPTETTIWSTARVIDAGEAPVVIGGPLANTQLYVLARDLAPVPVGVAGELYIGGHGLARGYLGRPDLTAERFVPDPFGAPGARIYRTGDVVRWRSDGTLEFLGRLDHQVKLRGFRIELGEIEAALRAVPGVADAAVAVLDDVLVAYYVERDEPVHSADAVLRQKLPAYMVPTVFVVLDALPLTPNGKLDRKALPKPARDAIIGYVAPRSQLELQLAAIWCDVLGVERVGIHDDFFARGGHSLLATRVVAHVRAKLGRDVPLRVLFDASTLETFAQAIERGIADTTTVRPPLVASPRVEHPALSFAQERLWFLSQLEPDGGAYHVWDMRRIEDLDVDALRRAFEVLVARHEILRTSFPSVDGVPYQHVHSPGPWPLPVDDARALDADAQRARIDSRRRALDEPFDLAAAPPIRAELVRVSDTAHVLLVVMHHIVTDGGSFPVLWRELWAVYDAWVADRPAPRLPPLPIQYADFAAWQRRWLTGDELARQLAFWTERLRGAPDDTPLPFKGPRSPVSTFAGRAIQLALPAPLSDQLRALARAHGATLFMTFAAALRALLARYTGQRDLVLGAPIDNRSHAELAGVVGMFANTLALRGEVRDDDSFASLLAREKAAALSAYEHQHTPFELIVDALGLGRSLSRTPLFQVIYQHHEAAPPSTRGESLAHSDLKVKLDLAVTTWDAGATLGLHVAYNVQLFDRGVIEELGRNLQRLLERVVVDPERTLTSFDLVGDDQRHSLVEGGLGPRIAIPDVCIHELFEVRARATPDAVAVVYEEESRTYRDLDREATALAHRLVACGVGPDVVVGLYLDRSVELVIAMLAVLKAGGAYLPLDPKVPVERLRYMATTASTAVVVGMRDMTLDGPWHQLAVEDALRSTNPAPLPCRARPHHLVYVLFTSGSTGQPKGVLVEHRNLVDYVTGFLHASGLPPETSYATVTTFASDLGNTAIFPALCGGGTLHLISSDRATSPTQLAEYFARHRVDVVKAVPSLAAAHLEAASSNAVLPRLRLVLGGEALPWSLVDRVSALAPDLQLLNHYGPTETTVGSLMRVPTAARRGATVPLGRPLPNQRVYVLDPWGHLSPDGVAGELYIGGAGVARGYAGRADLTADRFVPDLFAATPGARMYRTGDRTRRLADGTYEFLGRVDAQIKVRGFRVEPGEIEAALRAQPGVVDAAVVLREDIPGDPRLVAYVVGSLPEQTALSATLPEYMIPTAFVALDAFPLTTNGKLDRRALPAPERTSNKAYVAPRTDQEVALARVWAELLGVERVGLHDDFFALGGHSLLAIRLLAGVERRLGVKIPLRELFVDSTLAGLAARVVQTRTSDSALAGPTLYASAARRARLPAALRGVFKLNKLMSSDLFARHVWSAWIDGPLDLHSLERAVAAMRVRHALLRTRFFDEDTREVLEVLAPTEVECFALSRTDVSSLPAAEQEGADAEFHRSASFRPLAVGHGEVMTVALSRWSETRHRLTVSLHNIASDAESLAIFVNELCDLWRALADAPERDPMAILPPAALQYHHLADYLERVRESEMGARQRAFWTTRLDGIPPLELPVDSPRDVVDAQREANAGIVAFRSGAVERELPHDVLTAIERIADGQRATVMSTLVAAMAGYLSERTAQRDLAFVTRLSHRYIPGLERALGFLVNPLVLRISTEGAPTFSDLVARTHEVVTDAFDNGECDLFELAPYSAFRFCLVYTRATSGGERSPTLPSGNIATRAPHPGASAGSRIGYDLVLWLKHLDDGVRLALAYNQELFRETTAAELLEGYIRYVTAASRG